MYKQFQALAAAFLFAFVGTKLNAAEPQWPQFRGVGGRGIGTDSRLPDKWSATENVAWKTEVAGRGWSSPIVCGDRVFLTTVVNTGESEKPKKGLYFGGNRLEPPKAEHHWKVIALDLTTGKPMWERTVHTGAPQTAIHLKNSFASETPVTDGERLYVYFGNVGVFCFDLAGELLWSQRVEPHKMRDGWGTAASPVLHGERLYIVNDNDEASYLLALDKRTGKEIWRTPRDEKSNWATPFIWQQERIEIITPGSGKVRSYDLDGKLLWWFEGMSSITIATPYTDGGLLYVSSGYVLDRRKPLYAIRPGAAGDISLKEEDTSNTFIAWCQKMSGPYNPSTLLYEGRLYVLYDRGIMACYDATTGKPIYEKARLGGQAYTSSPWAYGGKVFCLNEDGETFVVKAGDMFEVLHQNSLGNDDMTLATPAIAGDRLLIRTAGRLYCVKKP